MRALTCAFDAMSLPFLTQLQISTFDYIDSNTWATTFGKLPLLECVYLQYYATHQFFEALVCKMKAAEISTATCRKASFHKLRYIHLEGTDSDSPIRVSISVDMLLDYLTERFEKNPDSELPVLRLEDCIHISKSKNYC